MVRLVSADAHGLVDAVVAPWREVTDSSGPDRRRIRVIPDDNVHVYPLTRAIRWVVGTGRENGQGRFLEVRGPHVATYRLPLADLLAQSIEHPSEIALTRGEPLDGRTIAADGTAAAGTLITLFELVSREESLRDNRGYRPRRTRWIAETASNWEGRFRFTDLSRQPHALFAVHPRLGRAEIVHPGLDPVTLRLESTAKIVGRVWMDGIPAVGIGIRLVPDHVDFARAIDPFSLLALPTTTDRDGRFSLGAPAEGRVELVVGGRASPYGTSRPRICSGSARGDEPR